MLIQSLILYMTCALLCLVLLCMLFFLCVHLNVCFLCFFFNFVFFVVLFLCLYFRVCKIPTLQHFTKSIKKRFTKRLFLKNICSKKERKKATLDKTKWEKQACGIDSISTLQNIKNKSANIHFLYFVFIYFFFFQNPTQSLKKKAHITKHGMSC